VSQFESVEQNDSEFTFIHLNDSTVALRILTLLQYGANGYRLGLFLHHQLIPHPLPILLHHVAQALGQILLGTEFLRSRLALKTVESERDSALFDTWVGKNLPQVK